MKRIILVLALLLGPTLAAAHGDTLRHADEAEEVAAPAPDSNALSPEERLAALEAREAELAEAGGATGSKGDPRTIEERLQALEERQTELYHTLAEKKAAGLATKITDRITISGLLEVEASAEDVEFADGTSDAASDLVLATAQLGFGLKLTEEVRGNISFLFEEDDTPLEVDEAAIDVNYAPLFGRFGRLYVPFGVFHSHFISDPLTLELGETRETAALLGYGHELFSLSAFIFNGDAEKIGKEDHIRDWGASLVLTPAEGIELGGSYLSDLADSNAELLLDEIANPDNLYGRRVGGWSAFALLERGPFGVSGEILGAARSFAVTDLDADGNGKGDKPLTWNLEVSWAPQENVELAVRYEGSDEFFGFPERQYGADISWSPWEYATVSLEYLHAEFDSHFGFDEDGNALDERELVTAQLALEF